MATDRIADALRAERGTRARGIAARVDLALEDDLRQLDLIAGASIGAPDAAPVAAHVRGIRLGESVLRVGPAGDVLWARSVADGGETSPVVTSIEQPSGDRWHAEATGLTVTARGPRVFLLLPARESDPVGGAIAAAIDPQSAAVRALLTSYAEEPYRVEIVDERGREIAASRPGGTGARGAGDAPAGDQLVAFAPVSNGRWRIRLAQPRSEAIGPVLTLRRILVGSSLLLLPFAVLTALATARSIRQPVLAMTAAAERLARGEFAGPIRPAGEDEIGRLAAALEQLRQALEADERRSLLLKRVISAQEEERRRIARELHDETTQQLTALALQIESVSTATPEAAADTLARARALVRSAIDDLHRVIYDLRPSVLDDLGLLPAIRSYAETHLEPRGIEVHCEFPDAAPELSREATTALYRVGQEALTNVARHANAETVLIGCTVVDARIALEIEDDGVGFAPAAVARPRETGEGLGVLGMRERLALLGGRLEIESEPGRGTRVVAVLPLGAGIEART